MTTGSDENLQATFEGLVLAEMEEQSKTGAVYKIDARKVDPKLTFGMSNTGVKNKLLHGRHGIEI